MNTNSLRELQLEKANHVPNYSTAKMKDFNNMKSFLKNAQRASGGSIVKKQTDEGEGDDEEKPTTLVIEDSGVMDSDSDGPMDEEDGFVVTSSNFMKTQAKFTEKLDLDKKTSTQAIFLQDKVKENLHKIKRIAKPNKHVQLDIQTPGEAWRADVEWRKKVNPASQAYEDRKKKIENRILTTQREQRARKNMITMEEMKNRDRKEVNKMRKKISTNL